MQSSQQLNVLCLVKENFSKATDEDGRLVWDGVKGYAFEDARDSIREHRIEKGSQAWRPDIRRIRSLAAARFNERMREHYADKPIHRLIADMRPELRDLDPASRIVSYFEAAWEHSKETAGAEVAWAARAYILSHCRRALEEAKVSDAEVLARTVVELKPGEKIATRAVFKSPSPPPTSWDSLKSLAVAEHGTVGSPAA